MDKRCTTTYNGVAAALLGPLRDGVAAAESDDAGSVELGADSTLECARSSAADTSTAH
jgi:hypothetical protein